jgi:hypothetical protein
LFFFFDDYRSDLLVDCQTSAARDAQDRNHTIKDTV